jgi:hypothetical protein
MSFKFLKLGFCYLVVVVPRRTTILGVLGHWYTANVVTSVLMIVVSHSAEVCGAGVPELAQLAARFARAVKMKATIAFAYALIRKYSSSMCPPTSG